MSNDVRQRLVQQIREWNINRLDLFALSEPNQDLEFFGVMRFFYQDEEEKVSTKCVRVSSTATTKDVLDILIEKFRPDLRMLSRPLYALYEVHSNGEERKLSELECPLLVQLNWGKDDREGRFLLKREIDKTTAWSGLGDMTNTAVTAPDLERRLSKREKKELKKREKEAQRQEASNKENIAKRLYEAAPDSSFTRSISNPEMVMRRRRQMTLERKLQQIRASDDGPNSGGTLKIYGETICPEVPYKTLLLSMNDTATHVVRETLDKYGLEKENAHRYCLMQVVQPSDAEEFYGKHRQEFLLEDDDCPLEILTDMRPTTGPVTFHLVRRPASGFPHEADTLPGVAPVETDKFCPLLVALNPDGIKPYDARSFPIPRNGLELGQEKSPGHNGSFLKLVGPDICRQHCAIEFVNGAVVVIPLDRAASVCVNNLRIYSATPLSHGASVLLGTKHHFQFIDPMTLQKRMGTALADDYPHNVDEHTGPGNASVDVLPALVEYRDDAEDDFVRLVLSDINVDALEFKLTPTYVVYMAVRHRLMHGFRPHVDPKQRTHVLAALTTKAADTLYQTIEKVNGDALALAVWMANSSELLHFFSCDVDIARLSDEAQNVLAECVQHAFLLLVDTLQNRLHQTMPAFISTNPDVDSPHDDMQPSSNGPRIDDVVNLLSWTMSLLLRARVNAALTIQLFSQLFHFINQWLFNRLIAHNSSLCTRSTGQRLIRRLRRVEMWAEKQGLELAAECHLARILQAAVLLESQKATADVVADLSSSCFKLNSLQLRALLQNYKPGRDEQPISPELIERAVVVAQNTADTIARREGSEVKLLEDLELQLPFLLPEDGYSCDFVTGCNAELAAFLEPLRQAGICRIVENTQSSGKWNVFLSKPQNSSGHGAFPVMEPSGPAAERSVPPQQHLDLLTVTFDKVKNSIGLSIIEAVGDGQRDRSIYIKYVIPDGAAARDGRLEAGDQLLEVDGRSLIGLTQEQAANIMKSTGQTVTLKVAKRAALYHGLGTLLDQPSPQVQQHSGTRMPLSQPPAVQPSYQQVQQPRQQHQLYAEPHYATPRSSQYAVHRAPHADQREPQYDRQQPAYRQYEKSQQEQPQRMESRPGVQQQSSWQQPHPVYDRNQQQQQQPLYHQEQPRHEPPYHQQPTYSAQIRPQYEPQYQQQQQAPYHQQHGRPPSAIEPSYTEPHVTQDGRIGAGRSKSASDVNHPEAMGAWPSAQPSLQYGHGRQPPLSSSSQEPLSSWKSYEGPGQRGLASGIDMQEPVKVDRRHRETAYDGRRIIPDDRQYGEQWSVPAVNRQTPHWQESDRRSQPQLNATKQQSPASFASHPELSTSHQFVESANSIAPFTSNDLLRRAQPSQQGVTSPTPFTQQVPAERRSIPVGGHLRAIDPKDLKQMTAVMPPIVSEHKRPQTYYKLQSQVPAAAESTYMKPADRSQSLSRAVQPPAGAWERAKKEEELRHVELEQKRRREEEIHQLESRLPDQLSPAEIDRLRRLKLNAEFDRRATELERSGDQSADTNTDMTAAGRAQVVHHLHQEIDEKRRQMQQQLDLRDRQLIEANRAKADFEERRRQQQLQAQVEQQNKMELQRQEQQILQSEELLRNQMLPGSVQYGVYQPERNTDSNNGNDEAPPPPERTSSFGLYQSAAAAKKAVSFQPGVSVEGSGVADGSNAAVSYHGTTPDRQISVTLAPPTPGVVGAQELYPDPRDRVRSSHQEPYYMTPDRMTFGDKMRRFAAEAGEDTPVPKAKISRAQQRIEVPAGQQ